MALSSRTLDKLHKTSANILIGMGLVGFGATIILFVNLFKQRDLNKELENKKP